MSNQAYNLDERAKQTGEYFEFILGGNTYRFRYPTVEESEGFRELKTANGETDTEAVTQKMYSFIEPTDKDAPSIEDALKKVTLPVLKEFSLMLTKELGVESS